MTRKKWTGGEPVLSVETEDEFHQALPLGLPVEVTPAIAEGIGLMAEDVSTLEEIIAAQERRLYAPANAKRPDRRVLGEMAALKLASASSPSPQCLDHLHGNSPKEISKDAPGKGHRPDHRY